MQAVAKLSILLQTLGEEASDEDGVSTLWTENFLATLAYETCM